ncbi:hypothetical protein [Terrabacter sp. 2RAF25]|uniref:hypothetical protein n=1 Tax=Terrabacter sp. 2RAF25 TaxID=3232998 RepID=UPI003F98ADE1
MKNVNIGMKLAQASVALAVCLGTAACGNSAPASSGLPTSSTTAAATPAVTYSTTPAAAATTEDITAQEAVAVKTPMPVSGKAPKQADADKLFLIAAEAHMGPAGDDQFMSLRDSICEKLRDDPTPSRYAELVDAVSGTGSDALPAEAIKSLINGSVMSACWDARAALPPKEAAGLQEIAAGGPSSSISEGSWEVGTDIKPGKYRTDGRVTNCYWAITRGGSNGQDIIANDNVSGGRPTVTLKKGQQFESNRCGDWSLVK